MGEEEKASMPMRILSLLLFVFFTFVAFFLFTNSTLSLISALHVETSVIDFDKGAMYLFGCGIFCLAVTIVGIKKGILGFDLTPKQNDFLAHTMMASLLLAMLLPHIVHYSVDDYLKKRNYALCREATDRWMTDVKLYYTSSDEACNQLVNEKQYKHKANKTHENEDTEKPDKPKTSRGLQIRALRAFTGVPPNGWSNTQIPAFSKICIKIK